MFIGIQMSMTLPKYRKTSNEIVCSSFCYNALGSVVSSYCRQERDRGRKGRQEKGREGGKEEMREEKRRDARGRDRY